MSMEVDSKTKFTDIITREKALKLQAACIIYKAIFKEEFDACTLDQSKIDRFQAILDGEDPCKKS